MFGTIERERKARNGRSQSNRKRPLKLATHNFEARSHWI